MIDVCIVTYQNKDTIGGALGSVEARVPGSRVSIWDNSPDLGTADAVDLFRAGSTLDVRVYRSGRNIGFGDGCNRLAALSEEELLMFLNPDAEVRSWPAKGTVAGDGRLVGAMVFSPDGAIQETYGQDRTIWWEFRTRILRRHLGENSREDVFETSFVSGAALLVNRARYLECGGFDSARYFMYYEDIDLGRRWRLAGGTVEVDPSWRVTHIGGFSATRNHSLALVRSYESARAYHMRWSTAPWLFRVICIAESALKLTLAVPRGRVGNTSLETQFRYFRYLLSGRSPES